MEHLAHRRVSFLVMPNNIIDNRTPNNTLISNNTPGFQSIDIGSISIVGNTTTYSQTGIKYSQAGINYGGIISSNEGRAPSNMIVNQ